MRGFPSGFNASTLTVGEVHTTTFRETVVRFSVSETRNQMNYIEWEDATRGVESTQSRITFTYDGSLLTRLAYSGVIYGQVDNTYSDGYFLTQIRYVDDGVASGRAPVTINDDRTYNEDM